MKDPQKPAQKIWGLLFNSRGQKQGLSRARLYCPLPLIASPRACSFQMNCLIRMCDNSLFSQLWLMPKDYSIGPDITQPTRGPRLPPLGKKCPRAEREGERACCLYQTGCHPGLRDGQPRGYQPVAPTHPNWLWKSGSTTVTLCSHGSLNWASSRQLTS